MRKFAFLYLLFIIPVFSGSQTPVFRVLPELGVSNPVGDFKEVNVFAKRGIQGGFNFDFIRGKVGLGFYGGFDKNNIQFDDLLPPANPGLQAITSSDIRQYNWKQFLAGAGPMINLDLSEKFNIELMSKLGVAKFSYPDFAKFVEVIDPINERYTLYQTKNEVFEKKLNPMLLSALRLNFKATDKIDIALSGNYKFIGNVRHSYSYLDADFNPEMSNETLIQNLQAAPTVTEIRGCNFNSFGVTLGISFNIGRPGGKMEPPIPDYPEDGATISLQEADSLTLKWQKEKPNVQGANYNLWLYQVEQSSSDADSLIFKTKIKRKQQFTLPDHIKLEADSSYIWKVQAVDHIKLKLCIEGCHSIQAMFRIASIVTDQYIELSSQNNGNYVEVGNHLRTCLHPCGIAFPIHCGGGRIFNQDNEVVLSIDDLQRGQTNEQYTSDEKGRINFNLTHLPEGYYLFEQTYEHGKKYYLRFKITRSNATIKK